MVWKSLWKIATTVRSPRRNATSSAKIIADSPRITRSSGTDHYTRDIAEAIDKIEYLEKYQVFDSIKSIKINNMELHQNATSLLTTITQGDGYLDRNTMIRSDILLSRIAESKNINKTVPLFFNNYHQQTRMITIINNHFSRKTQSHRDSTAQEVVTFLRKYLSN